MEVAGHGTPGKKTAIEWLTGPAASKLTKKEASGLVKSISQVFMFSDGGWSPFTLCGEWPMFMNVLSGKMVKEN